MALAEPHRVFSWGSGSHGKLGHVLLPRHLPDIQNSGEDFLPFEVSLSRPTSKDSDTCPSVVWAGHTYRVTWISESNTPSGEMLKVISTTGGFIRLSDDSLFRYVLLR
jgi:hypothetical protein